MLDWPKNIHLFQGPKEGLQLWTLFIKEAPAAAFMLDILIFLFKKNLNFQVIWVIAEN
jgi:hypothetical protein